MPSVDVPLPVGETIAIEGATLLLLEPPHPMVNKVQLAAVRGLKVAFFHVIVLWRSRAETPVAIVKGPDVAEIRASW